MLLVLPSACGKPAPVPPISAAVAPLPAAWATIPSEPVPDDATRISGIAALDDQTCVWTRSGQAVCASPSGMHILPRQDAVEVAVRTEGWVVRTADARVYELHPTADPKELQALRGASKVACSRHFCAALVDGQLLSWVFSFREIDPARDGDNLTDFTMRGDHLLGIRTDGEIRSFHVVSCYNDGKVVAASGRIVSDCVVGEDDQLRCGSAPPVHVPPGLRLTTGVGSLAHHQPRDMVREVCGISEEGGVLCLGPPLGRPRTENQTYDWTPVPTLDDPAIVVGGGRHACALTRDGQVKCWGAYDRGQYGIRPDTERPRPIDDPGLNDPHAELLLTPDRLCLVGADASVCTHPHNLRWEPFDAGRPEFVSRDGDVVLRRDGRRVAATDPWGDQRSRARLPRGVTGVRSFVTCRAASYFLFEDGTLSATRAEAIEFKPDTDIGEDEWPPMHTLHRTPKVGNLVDVTCTLEGLASIDASGIVRHHDATGAPREQWFESATSIVSAGPTVCATVAGRQRCRIFGRDGGPAIVDDPASLRGLVEMHGRTDWSARYDSERRDRLCGRSQTGIRCIEPASKLDTLDIEVTDTPLPGPIRDYAIGPAHACARLEDARVVCWGAPQGFRLGRSIAREQPVDVTDRFIDALGQHDDPVRSDGAR